MARDTRFRPGGWIGERVRLSEERWLIRVPAGNPGMVDMFRRPIDLMAPSGPHEGGPWPWAGEFAGKWLIGATQSFRMTGNPVLAGVMNQVAAGLLANQDPVTGSLGLEAVDWDAWNQYHVMLGLLRRAQQVPAPQLLAAVRRAADRLLGRYLGRAALLAKEHPGDAEKNQAVAHVLLLLHQQTDHQPYLDLAQQIADTWTGNYVHNALRGQHFFSGTATRWESLHCVQAIAELYLITGDPRYGRAFEQIWFDLCRLERHADGGFGGSEGAVGDPDTALYVETCATVAWAAVCVDMLRIGVQAEHGCKAADELEISLFNALLGAQSPDGRYWTYHTPVGGALSDSRRVKPFLPQVLLGYRVPAVHDLDWQARDRYPQLSCCAANGPRGLGSLSEWAVMNAVDGVTVNFYGPSTTDVQAPDGTWVTIRQETDYPLGGQVSIRLDLRVPSRFVLRLRVPAWSASSTVAVNGTPQPCTPGRYAELDRTWLPGDRVEVLLDLSVRFVDGAGRTDGRVAVYRGPLLLTCNGQFGTDPLQPPPIRREQPSTVLLDEADAKVKATFATSAQPMVLSDYASAWGFGGGRGSGRPDVSVPWQFIRSAWLADHRDDDLLAHRLLLEPDGSVGGYSHPNEARWGFEDDVLTFYAADGSPSTRFTVHESRNRRQWLSGFSLLAPGIRHLLCELDEGIAGKVWQFSRRTAAGTSVIMPELVTVPGGGFDRATHPNETRWARDGGSLVLISADGRISTRFGPPRMVNGRVEYAGQFDFDPSITHVLTEIDPDLTGKLWRLWREDGGQPQGFDDKLHLLPDGRVDGHSYPNETRWRRRGDRLLLLGENGAATSTLDPLPCVNGVMQFAGPGPGAGVVHRLEERAVGWPLGPGYTSWLTPAVGGHDRIDLDPPPLFG